MKRNLPAELFSLLCKRAGKRQSQASIAKDIGVTSAAVAKTLPQLKALITITEHPVMKLKEIALDRDNRKAIALKRAENLRMLAASGLITHLTDTYPGSTTILFGSYSKGEDTVTSDVDIAVIGVERKTDLRPFERILERPIRIMHIRSLPELGRDLQESLFNGIVLTGHLETIR